MAVRSKGALVGTYMRATTYRAPSYAGLARGESATVVLYLL